MFTLQYQSCEFGIFPCLFIFCKIHDVQLTAKNPEKYLMGCRCKQIYRSRASPYEINTANIILESSQALKPSEEVQNCILK